MLTSGSSATVIQFASHGKTPLDVALDYVARGWNPVPVGFRSKKPSAGEGWQLIRITASNAAQYFNGGEQNIGLQMGPASNSLTDGDMDTEQARAIAPYFMPRTKSKFGRASARWSHYLYYSNLAEITDDGSIPFKDPTTKPEAMILELRIGGGNKGAQTVAPGSIHSDTGEPIVWEEDAEPTRVPGDDLLRCAKITAALALLARHWPQRGSKARHFTALRLGGFLARCGWNEIQIELALEALTKAANDEEPWDRKTAGRDAQRHFASGGNTAGFPALREDFGEPIAKRVAEWLDYDSVREQGNDARPGTDAGKSEPEQKPARPYTLAETRAVFQKWLGAEYDLGTLDAVLAVAAAEKLSGDPPWLLIISGPGNAKTETVQATSGLGARIISTITSEGALLSASPRKNRSKMATGGLLRQIGERGILTIKDFTSIISANREVRTQVLAALREIFDGHWVRNVGSDGGQCLEWRGRIIVIGACTTVWDQAHAVVSIMGDRFVLVRSNSSTGRMAAGIQAIRNTGTETEMRREMAAAVTGLISQVKPDCPCDLTDDERGRILQAADIVTLARTGVETDYRGDIIDAHAPEMPTRFAKQLTQVMRGALAAGMLRPEAMALAIRCARDSMPPLRLDILEDIAKHPGSRIIDVRRRLQRPRATADRALQALHVLGLLVCNEEEEQRDDGPRYIRHYSLSQGVSLGALSVPDLSVDNLF